MFKKMIATVGVLTLSLGFALPNEAAHADIVDGTCTITIDQNKHQINENKDTPVSATGPCKDAVFGYYDIYNKNFWLAGLLNTEVKHGDAVKVYDTGDVYMVYVNTIEDGKQPGKPNVPPKPVPKPEKSGFVDVPKTHTHYDGIMHWSKKDVINGYPRKNDNYRDYRPSNNVSREHTAVLFNRSLELERKGGFADIIMSINDIGQHDEYTSEIVTAYQHGIFSGDSKGNFNPRKSLSREQMATVLVNAYDLESKGKTTKVNMKKVDPSHQSNVQVLSDLDITNQRKDFRPREKVTRGQFATFLYRAEQSK